MGEIAAVILAAGQGKRMRSKQPKVLHRIMGRPLISFPIALARQVGCSRIVVVVGHGREAVEQAAVSSGIGDAVSFALQAEQRGTGHAVMAALPSLKAHKGALLILSGDVPLVDKQTIGRLKRAYNKTGGPLALVSFEPEAPKGYGRVIREGGRPVAIREARDATQQEKRIREVNAGIYLVDIAFLRKSVKKLTSNNDQGELYLTDLVEMAAATGEVAAVTVPEAVVQGVNDREDLAMVEASLRSQRNRQLMQSGVTLRQPDTVQVDLDAKVGPDTEIGPGAHILGKTVIGRGCRIGAGAIISDTVIKNEAVIKAYCVVESASVASGAEVGPMARLRPGADIGPNARIGNWVEVKNTVIGRGSKANHLSYLGDGIVGEGVNVGAGTIFCNYDGFLKHQTVLGNDVFIGSDSQLVAPVTVGDGAYVASGSTVTRDVPPDGLAISRVAQVNRKGTAARLKQKLKAEKEKQVKAKEKQTKEAK